MFKQKQGTHESVSNAVSTRQEVNRGQKHRLQFEFAPAAYNRLQIMKSESKAASFSELVRNALRLYEWFIEQRRANRTILVKDGDTIKEVEFVF